MLSSEAFTTSWSEALSAGVHLTCAAPCSVCLTQGCEGWAVILESKACSVGGPLSPLKTPRTQRGGTAWTAVWSSIGNSTSPLTRMAVVAPAFFPIAWWLKRYQRRGTPGFQALLISWGPNPHLPFPRGHFLTARPWTSPCSPPPRAKEDALTNQEYKIMSRKKSKQEGVWLQPREEGEACSSPWSWDSHWF